jgi:hypothetical protein
VLHAASKVVIEKPIASIFFVLNMRQFTTETG